MKLKYLFLVCILLFVSETMAQGGFVGVIVELKAGAKIPGSIKKGIDFNAINKLALTDLENAQKNIPLAAIQEVKTNSGEILFPVPEPAQQTEKPVQETKPTSENAKMYLAAGGVIEGKLFGNTNIIASQEKLRFQDAEGAERNIPLSVIEKIEDSYGNIIYPKEQNNVKQLPVQTVASQYDKIILNSGGEVNADLKLEGKSPTSFEKIPFVGDDGNERTIPLAVISSIVDRYGTTIYPIKTVPAKVEAPIIRCGPEGEKLKVELIGAFQGRFMAIDKMLQSQTQEYKSANFDMEEKLKKEIYRLIDGNVSELSKVNTMVKAVIRIYVDANGNFVKVEDEVFNSEQVRYYNVLRDNDIYPKLKYLKYDVNQSNVEFKNEYQKIYDVYKDRIQASTCPNSELENILSDGEKGLSEREKNIVATYTVYSIPIEFNFKNKYEKWTYYNGVLNVKEKKKFVEITSPEVKQQFNSKFTKKQKNGKYVVNATYYTALSDKSKIDIHTIKRKYKYLTHFGVSAFAHFPITRVGNFPSKFNNTLGDLYTFNANVIFHRIGFFGGTMYNFDKFTKKETGYYINQNFPTYGEGGIYLGLAEWFFLKGGYSYLKADIGEYNNELLLINIRKQISHGFIAGIALMFPFVNLEAGYNSNIGSIYFGAGLHVTLNK